MLTLLKRATATVILVIASAAMLPIRSDAAASGHTYQPRGTAPACAVVFIIGHQSCYAPSQEAYAVRGISWAVSPNAAVKATLGLPLSQVSVNRMPSSGIPNDVHPVQVDYLYGPLVHDHGRMGASPVAVRVIENPGRLSPTTRMVPGIPLPVRHHACGTTIEISAAADPARPHPAYGPWFAIANFPHGNHSVGIVANVDQQRLTALTCRLLRAG